MSQSTLAIIGSGAAGMACGYFLHKQFNLTVYEQNDYIGGHANTVVIDDEEETVHVDTAFIIFNDINYPLFSRMLAELDVPSIQCSMGFSFKIVPTGWEYNTKGLSYYPSNLKNLLDGRFRNLLRETGRFYKQAREIYAEPQYADYSIAEYIKEKGYSRDFLNYYLIPIIAVVWSIPPDDMLDYPAVTMIDFLKNHGAFQGFLGRKRWSTVAKGSGSYRDKIVAPFKDKIRLNCPVSSVAREDGKVKITDAKGNTQTYDRVIMACHADQALNLLSDPSPRERDTLKNFRYSRSKIILHNDAAVLPKNRRLWAGWNYLVEDDNNGKTKASFSYHMNTLQKVSKRKDYFVTLNDTGRVDESKILREFDYEHPIFDLDAVRAQEELQKLNENGQTYFCGSYFKYGFHEDAFRSGIEACRKISGEPIWG